MGLEPPPLPEGPGKAPEQSGMSDVRPPPLPGAVPPVAEGASRASGDRLSPPQIPCGERLSPLPPTARPWGFWATVGWSVLIMAANLMVQGVVAVILALTVLGKAPDQIKPADVEENGLVLALATIASVPITCGLAIFFAWQRRGMNVRDYLGLSWPRVKTAGLWTLCMIGLVTAMDGTSAALGRPLVPEVMVRVYETAGNFTPLLWLAIIVGAPLSEEFFFRGFVLEGLRWTWVKPWGAVLVTSCLWAALHLQYDLYGISSIFLSGLLLGYARLKTGSLWLCVYLHGLMNLIASLELVLLT